jgi:hypothetical protein
VKVAPHEIGLPAIGTHLFVIAPNNSGSTLLRTAIAAAPACWSLEREGQHMPGFAGPSTRSSGLRLIWAAKPEWIAALTDPAAFDWHRIRLAWHLQATSQSPEASVLVTSSPPFLFLVEALTARFPGARFLFLVRNPYAAIAGILRRGAEQPVAPGEDLRVLAARHMVAVFTRQRANIAAHGDSGIALDYEALCADPDATAARIRMLVPQLTALDLAAARRVKGIYAEPLRDMNAAAIAQLSADDLTAINSVFDEERPLLDHFGYSRIA